MATPPGGVATHIGACPEEVVQVYRICIRTLHLLVISVMIIGVMRLSHNERAVSEGRFRHVWRKIEPPTQWLFFTTASDVQFWSLDLRPSDILFLLPLLSSTLLLLPFLLLFKVLLQGLQGQSTVGNRVFDCRVQVNIGLIKAFGLKDWVPAKMLPATCWNNCVLNKYRLYSYCMAASDLRAEVVTVTSLPVFCL